MKVTHKIAFILLVIGGLNWGLVGIGGFLGSNWNVVGLLLGSIPWLLNLVYLLVGISTLIIIFGHKKDCKTCDSKVSAPVAGQQ